MDHEAQEQGQEAHGSTIKVQEQVQDVQTRRDCREFALCEVHVKRLGWGQPELFASSRRAIGSQMYSFPRVGLFQPPADLPSIDLAIQLGLAEFVEVAV